MKQKRIRQILYSEQKLVRKDNRIQYIEDPDGYLYADMIYPTKIKAKHMPKWFVYGRYYRYWGYLSAKDVVDLRCVPNSWVNHFLRDDFLIISYHEPIVQVSESKQFWERYKGYDETIDDGAILHFLKAVKKYSDIMPIKFPKEFGSFKFNVQTYFEKD